MGISREEKTWWEFFEAVVCRRQNAGSIVLVSLGRNRGPSVAERSDENVSWLDMSIISVDGH
jgi:hypothetical protein